jgi:hypothetical protein
MPVPDGSAVFLSSDDGAGNCSLWRSDVIPPDTDTWNRVRFKPAAGAMPFTSAASQIRVSPEWDSDSAVYWFDTLGAGPGIIERSVDGGDVFATRNSPAPIGDAAVESKDVLYVSDNGANLTRRSSNGAWFFDLPIAAPVAAVSTLAMCPTYPELPVPGNVVCGGIFGGIGLSLDGAQSWIPMGGGVPPGGFIQVLADVDYANNNTLYAGSGAPGAGIWRYQFGTSTAWEQIALPGAAAGSVFPATGVMRGLAMQHGHLYGAWNDPAAAATVITRSRYRQWLPVTSWMSMVCRRNSY